MSIHNQTNKSETVSGSPSQDTTGRFAVDQLLRQNGWVIYARDSGREPLWQRRDKICTQRDALSLLDRDKVCDAEYLEDLYRDVQE